MFGVEINNRARLLMSYMILLIGLQFLIIGSIPNFLFFMTMAVIGFIFVLYYEHAEDKGSGAQ